MKNNDARIKKLKLKVEKAKQKLGAKPKKALETNGLFKFNDGVNDDGRTRPLNINTITDIATVAEAATHLMVRFTAHNNACGLLEIDNTFSYSGYEMDQWITDFKHIIAKINYTAEERKLKAVERQLAELMSEDAKTELALDDIENLL